MKRQFLLITLLVAGYMTWAQTTLPTFLIGTWKVDGKETYERWQTVEDLYLTGESYKMVDGEEQVTETLTLKVYRGKLIYTATVPDQNDGKGVEFILNPIDEKTFSFENSQHDFPQKIIYKLIHSDILYVQVLGEGDQGFSFHMYRQQEEEKTPSGLGVFSMSLAVQDLKASYEFYRNLGFEHLEGAGSIEQQWMIMVQGDKKIGLFQGMFENNMLTFNPSDARPIAKKLKAEGFEFAYAIGLDKEEGPCSFSFSDPDGNLILVDQH